MTATGYHRSSILVVRPLPFLRRKMARYFILILATCSLSYTVGQFGDGICGARTPRHLTRELQAAYHKAFAWVLSERTESWGWPGNTEQAILSLQLTNESWFSRSDLTAQLSVKQLEIEMLADLSQPEPTVTPGLLAYYIMALNSTYHDVSDFYQHDLVKTLEVYMCEFPKFPDFSNYFQYGLALLSLRQSGAKIKASYIQQLADGSSNGSYPYGSDVTSMALMAMVCIQDKTPPSQQHLLSQLMSESSDWLVSQQKPDGTFGNAISTALATQALLSANVPFDTWDCVKAVQSVVDAQTPQGDFVPRGLLGALQILPLLVKKTFADVRFLPTDNIPPAGSLGDFQITLQVEYGDIPIPIDRYSVITPAHSTLHEAMTLATIQHTDFSFDTVQFTIGSFIVKIKGVEQDQSHYWLIFIEDHEHPAQTGIDGIITTDGGLYIFSFTSL